MKNYDKLDNEGLENLVAHLLDGGVHGLFVLGTNGEAPSLSYALRKEMIKRCCTLVNGRLPVLVGITDTSLAGSLEICETAAKAGADACVLAPPYYFPVDNIELLDYFETLAPRLSLPFLLYNMPTHTKVNLSPETVRKVKEMGAVGLKDSSGDMLYAYTIMETFREDRAFSFLVGTELYLPETIMNGGHGAVAGGANIFPKLFVDYYEASLRRDHEAIDDLRKKVLMLYHTVYQVGRYASQITKGTKCALSVLDICDDYMAPPFRKFKPAERQQVENHINVLRDIL